MLQLGGEADLALEPLDVHPGRHLGREHLHHHLPAEPHFLGEEDPAHPAAAQLLIDAVSVTEGGLEAVAEVRHGANV